MDATGRGVAARERAVRYRYRTTVLLGRWRSSPQEAARDAVRARQAENCEKGEHGIRWRVNGEIEEEAGTDGPDANQE